MSDKSKIEWTEATWNPITGCTKVSPGCAYCYIERTPAFRIAGRKFERWSDDYGENASMSTDLQLHPNRLEQPLHWKRPRRIFVNSLSDLFEERVPEQFIAAIFGAMARAPQHTFQVLTKRPDRMRDVLSRLMPSTAIASLAVECPAAFTRPLGGEEAWEIGKAWPLPNVWLGVTAENQRWADERIPLLLDTPAAVRFVSCEPLLGPVDLRRLALYKSTHENEPSVDLDALTGLAIQPDEYPWGSKTHIDWVIAGGESGGPEYRRLIDWDDEHFQLQPKPHALEAVRSLRDQCVAAGVPFFFKQWGGPSSKSGGRQLDGRTWDEYPEAAR